jgi:putative ABC transport system permease protein
MLSGLADLRQDVTYGVRKLARSPGFTAVAVLTLALGIGANAAVFTVVDNLLFRPPPFDHVDRLMGLRDVNEEQGLTEADNVPPSPGNFLDWRDQGRSFEYMAAWRNWFYSVAGSEGHSATPEQIRGVRISPSFFPMLGVEAAIGRTFRPEEEEPGKDQVVVLSDGLWQRRYGGDPGIVGRSLLIDGRPFTVIGVLPDDFYFLQSDFEMWMPFSVDADFRGRDDHSVVVYARLAPGVSLAEAQAEMDTIAGRLEIAYPDTNKDWGVAVVPVHPPRYGERFEQALLVLLGAVGCVLLIACANVANLLLVRAGGRQRELAVRAAVGASRWRLVRQLLVESTVLAAIGGAAGVLVAAIALRVMAPLIPPVSTLTHPSPQIDVRVLIVTAAMALVTAVVFGLVPALHTSRTDSLRVSASPGGSTAGRVLLVAELALSVVLLVGAALLIRTLWNLQRVDPGFRTDRLLTMQVWLPERKYQDPSGVRAFSDELLRRTARLPGVRAVATVNTRPFLGWFLTTDVEVPGRIRLEGGREPWPTYRVVSQRYFDTLGATLVNGRGFASTDGPEGASVAVVNEAMARRYWPEVEPLGRQFRPRFPAIRSPWVPEARAGWFTVIGVVSDFREHTLDEQIVPVAYFSQRQNPSRLMSLVVRSEASPTSLSEAVQAEIRAIDGDLGVYDLRTMDTILSQSVAQPRFNSVLLWIFASLALLLSAVGVYGVTSYLVARRVREFAIRIALGARSAEMFRLVTREAVALATAGVVVGALGALLLARVLANVLYDVAPTDLTILFAASSVVFVVALIACCRPAWYAMRVDPMRVLQAE